MARGGFNNALAGGSIDDFLRQLRGQAKVPGVPVNPIPGSDRDGGGMVGPGGSGPFIPPIPGGRDPRLPGGTWTAGPETAEPLSMSQNNGRSGTPSTGGVMTQPQAQGSGGSGNPVNVMPYKNAPPAPPGASPPAPAATPDPPPPPAPPARKGGQAPPGTNLTWSKPAPGTDQAFANIPEPTAQQQNQNQPPPPDPNQPSPGGKTLPPPPPSPDQQAQPNPVVSNWENFIATHPDMQWMRDAHGDPLRAAQNLAKRSSDPGIRQAAQAYLDATGGGGGQTPTLDPPRDPNQPPPPDPNQPPPPTPDQGQPSPASANWENFFATDQNVQWMRDQGMDARKAAEHFVRQPGTPEGLRQAAQAYLDANTQNVTGGEVPQPGAGGQPAPGDRIAQARAALPKWVLDRMSAEDALAFAQKNPDSKIAEMLRNAGVQ